MSMTLEELREGARLTDDELVDQCGSKSPGIVALVNAQLDKAYGEAFIKWCESRNICEVVEGELPKFDYELHLIAFSDHEFVQKETIKWHKQSLKPVSSLLGGE
ncbi:hypothetical protein LCGC14_3073970 [marine sediment metagenome]|uniref:Uncharacterized protein n=1 Tax=marine sediment metagenome TaxID=412755 RepID=A0A0F8WFX9_9ZZZZ